MNRVLIVYSTTDGHTIKICQRIQSVLESNGHTVSLLPVESVSPADLESFDTIVLGASIRYGKHKKEVYDFVLNNKSILQKKKNAMFSVSLVARKPNRNTPETNPYLRKFLASVRWTPGLAACFAGKVDYQKYRPMDRLMIRLIMFITKGPTDPHAVVEFTDWDNVESFAKSIAE